MLGSVANINIFDNVHGSSNSLGDGFGRSSQKMQAEQDHGNNPYKNSTSKKYAYGTSNNIVMNKQVKMEGNNVNMKKIKSEQVIFESKPKESGDVFSKV